MAQLVYIDETGSVGRGGKQQRYLTLVAVVVDEAMVQPLAGRLREIATRHLGDLPDGFEFHGNELWSAKGWWQGKSPAELLAVFEDVIGLLQELEIHVVHASIDKPILHDRYGGRADGNAYRLALQFLLEKLDAWRQPRGVLRILIADEAKQEQVKAIEMVADMQQWSGGEVPGRQLVSIVDSMHFVQSSHSPGVQLADMVAFLLHRARLDSQGHPDADAAVERMRMAIAEQTPTYRQSWPVSDRPSAWT